MPKLLAADHILYDAFRFELEQALKSKTPHAMGKDLPRVSADDMYNPLYRWRDGRVPWITTVERKLMPCNSRVARWLSGALRRSLDPSTSPDDLIAIRCDLLRDLVSPEDVCAWSRRGLATAPGTFSAYLTRDLLVGLTLELGTLRARDLSAPSTFIQYGVIRGLLRQLARHEPAFAVIEMALTQHVVDHFFLPRHEAEYYVSGRGVPSGYDPRRTWGTCISSDELDSLYDYAKRVPKTRWQSSLRREWWLLNDEPVVSLVDQRGTDRGNESPEGGGAMCTTVRSHVVEKLPAQAEGEFELHSSPASAAIAYIPPVYAQECDLSWPAGINTDLRETIGDGVAEILISPPNVDDWLDSSRSVNRDDPPDGCDEPQALGLVEPLAADVEVPIAPSLASFKEVQRKIVAGDGVRDLGGTDFYATTMRSHNCRSGTTPRSRNRKRVRPFRRFEFRKRAIAVQSSHRRVTSTAVCRPLLRRALRADIGFRLQCDACHRSTQPQSRLVPHRPARSRGTGSWLCRARGPPLAPSTSSA